MLFTQYLKKSQIQHNDNIHYRKHQTLHPNHTQNSHRILTHRIQNTHSIAKSANNTICAQTSHKFLVEAEISNPLKRLQQRKQRAKSRSRSPSIISTNCTQQQIILFPNKYGLKGGQKKTFLVSDLKLCISCDNFIKQSDILMHEKICQGFNEILKMSKRDLFIYVEQKKRDNLIKRNQQINRLNKTNNMQTKVQIACKIAQLEKKIEYYNIVRENIKGMLI